MKNKRRKKPPTVVLAPRSDRFRTRMAMLLAWEDMTSDDQSRWRRRANAAQAKRDRKNAKRLREAAAR